MRYLYLNHFFVFLTDTEDLYSIGFQKVACRFGKEFTFGLKSRIMGQQSKEFAGIIIKELDLPLTVDEFLEETRKIFKELFPQSKLMPGKFNPMSLSMGLVLFLCFG